MHRIPIELLTKAAFSPFGEVIETDFVDAIVINEGFALRVNNLAQIDVAADAGAVDISLFVAKARQRPIKVRIMERHPLGSQMFLPLQERSWLILVCVDPLIPASYRAFEASGRQGVNYARNTWHHPLLVLYDDERFLVVDRKGPGNNLEEVRVDDPIELAGLDFGL